MGRRSKSPLEDILEILTELPWWVSVAFSGIVYVGFKWALPSIEWQNPFAQGMVSVLPKFAHFIAFIFLIPAPISAFNSHRKRKLLDSQSDLNTIRGLSWRQFEELVAEGYRRQGYQVVETTTQGADGGVDIFVKKNGDLFLVQCKKWQAAKVGVKEVREMYGLMAAHHAHGVVIMTTGMFTQEAKSFANGKAIDLVGGNQLAEFVCQGKELALHWYKSNQPKEPGSDKHTCPKCGAELVMRTARKGPHAGKNFFGCSSFPSCRHVVSVGG